MMPTLPRVLLDLGLTSAQNRERVTPSLEFKTEAAKRLVLTLKGHPQHLLSTGVQLGTVTQYRWWPHLVKSGQGHTALFIGSCGVNI